MRGLGFWWWRWWVKPLALETFLLPSDVSAPALPKGDAVRTVAGFKTARYQVFMKHSMLVCGIVFLAGCAQSSGVNQVGPDTFSVSAVAAPARGSSAAAEGIALSEARTFCQKRGAEILVLTTGRDFDSFRATFRCLNAGDTELRRPDVRPAPNVIIERR